MNEWIGWMVEQTSTAVPPKVENTEPRAQQGWVCPKCGRVNAPWVGTCPCSEKQEIRTSWYTNIPSYCISCPNHPSNGGSGICHCTLGSPQITCTTKTYTTTVTNNKPITIKADNSNKDKPQYIN